MRGDFDWLNTDRVASSNPLRVERTDAFRWSNFERLRGVMSEYKRPCEDCWHFRPAMQHDIESNQNRFGRCNLYGGDFHKRINANYASTSRWADWHCGREGKWFDSLLEVL